MATLKFIEKYEERILKLSKIAQNEIKYSKDDSEGKMMLEYYEEEEKENNRLNKLAYWHEIGLQPN